jgi:hypothetical protein
MAADQGTGFEWHRKPTRREVFLDTVDATIVQLIGKSTGGNLAKIGAFSALYAVGAGLNSGFCGATR